MNKKKFDLIVMGAGPGGYVGAIRAAQLGMRAGTSRVPSDGLLALGVESANHRYGFILRRGFSSKR